MDRPPEASLPPSTGARTQPVAPARWLLPRLPVLIGVVGLGAVVTAGSWFKREASSAQRAEAQAIQAEVKGLSDQVAQYQERFENLKWNAAKMRAAADATPAEPLRSWARERATKFNTFVSQIEQSAAADAFIRGSRETEALCRLGKISDARERLRNLRPPRFPSASEFRELQREAYLKPLAEFSRQNPAYYRALQANEPDTAREDAAALRAQLAAADLDVVTPQSLLMFELLSAVIPADDPLVADWAAIASAPDHFENPDRATVKRWREAKKAMRLEDWPTAVAAMQSITVSKIRTRQPFRAAYGRAILKNSPDQTAEAYPLMLEAATSGDPQARRWVAQEDVGAGRLSEALRWLEASVTDGDRSAVPEILKLYAKERDVLPRDIAHEAGVLIRITNAPDAPPLSWMLLARLYEAGEGVPASPEKAFRCYRRAADGKYVPAWPDTARCYLRGVGTALDFDQARDWAIRAFEAGAREESIPLLLELMQRAPDRAAAAVQELIEHEQVAAPAGFQDTRIGGPSMATLRMTLAKYLDQKGSFGAAARLYAQTGAHDAAAAHRHVQLTTVRVCSVCGGGGKVQSSVECPTCGGKGTVMCGSCDGRGYNFVPGTPPCATCSGAGSVIQDGFRALCSACGGTGKGKGSVIKQSCTQCSAGRATCRECVGGRIILSKECPECHGVGSRALADS
ncbi:MAG: hypothetical protein ABIZ04_05880 [Opitutus sp.]